MMEEHTKRGEIVGQQLEKAAQGASVEDSAEVRGPHATLAVKLQVRYSGGNHLLDALGP